MCGRFNLAGLTWGELWRLLDRGEPPVGWGEGAGPIPQRFNTAPTQAVPILRPEPALARWGLIPRWYQKPSREWKAATINARIEGVATAPSFRDAYARARCIVPMAGYYEWATLSADPKQPWYIRPAGNAPALLACGLWSEVRLPDLEGLTCAILTGPAVGPVAALHDRQPVLVGAEGAAAWLDGAALEAVPRLGPGGLAQHPVSKRVNTWRAEDPGLIEEVAL